MNSEITALAAHTASTELPTARNLLERLSILLEQDRLTLEMCVLILSRYAAQMAEPGLAPSRTAMIDRNRLACVQYCIDTDPGYQRPIYASISERHWCVRLTFQALNKLRNNLVLTMQAMLDELSGKLPAAFSVGRSSALAGELAGVELQHGFIEIQNLEDRLLRPQLKQLFAVQDTELSPDLAIIEQNIEESCEILGQLLLEHRAFGQTAALTMPATDDAYMEGLESPITASTPRSGAVALFSVH